MVFAEYLYKYTCILNINEYDIIINNIIILIIILILLVIKFLKIPSDVFFKNRRDLIQNTNIIN